MKGALRALSCGLVYVVAQAKMSVWMMHTRAKRLETLCWQHTFIRFINDMPAGFLLE